MRAAIMKQEACASHTDNYKICRLITRIPLVSNVKCLAMLYQSYYMLPADKKGQTTIKDRRSNSELEHTDRHSSPQQFLHVKNFRFGELKHVLIIHQKYRSSLRIAVSAICGQSAAWTMLIRSENQQEIMHDIRQLDACKSVNRPQTTPIPTTLFRSVFISTTALHGDWRPHHVSIYSLKSTD
jgi:hypothetical protein